mmetsp:Transcript_35628/g.32098  ORF Transcript_35628/g.32098 Transcript_35628/m.32098 type:complete len:401 (-) Transcript_35628:453-1655(-)
MTSTYDDFTESNYQLDSSCGNHFELENLPLVSLNSIFLNNISGSSFDNNTQNNEQGNSTLLQKGESTSNAQVSYPSIMPTADVILTYSPENVNECIQSVTLNFLSDGRVNLSSLISILRELGFSFAHKMIFYHEAAQDMYIYAGKEPLPEVIAVPVSVIQDNNGKKQIKLKVRTIAQVQEQLTPIQSDFFVSSECLEGPTDSNSNSGSHNVGCDDIMNDIMGTSCGSAFDTETRARITDDASDDSSESENTANKVLKGFRRRNQERNVTEVLNILKQWRALYNGIIDPQTGKKVKISLNEAANKVGVPKKSLEDYAMIIKHAKEYEFDFEKNKDMRFGLVRKYVKNCKKAGKAKNIITGFSKSLTSNSDFSNITESELEETTAPKTSSSFVKNSKKIHKI